MKNDSIDLILEVLEYTLERVREWRQGKKPLLIRILEALKEE